MTTPCWPHHTGKLLGTTNTRKCVEHCSTTPVLHSDGKDNMIDMITNCQYHNLTQEITTKEFSVQINETHQRRRVLL